MARSDDSSDIFSYPEPTFKEYLDLSKLDYRKECTRKVLNLAVNGVRRYINRELYIPGINGTDGSVFKYSGLAKNGSLVNLCCLLDINPLGGKGLEWKTALVQVVNMQEIDDALVEKLKQVAIDSTKKSRK